MIQNKFTICMMVWIWRLDLKMGRRIQVYDRYSCRIVTYSANCGSNSNTGNLAFNQWLSCQGDVRVLLNLLGMSENEVTPSRSGKVSRYLKRFHRGARLIIMQFCLLKIQQLREFVSFEPLQEYTEGSTLRLVEYQLLQLKLMNVQSVRSFFA